MIPFLLTSVLLSGCYSYHIAYADDSFIFSNELIEPIEIEEEKNLSGSISYRGEEILNNVRVVANFYLNYQSEPYCYASYEGNVLNSVKKGDIISYSFDVYGASYLAEAGIDIELGIEDYLTRSFITYRHLKVYTKLHEVINPDDYRLSSLYLNNVTLANGEEISEEYLFDGLKNEYILPYYYRLDPTILRFKYTSKLPFHADESYISFVDKSNLFPSIPTFNGKKRIGLIYEQVEDEIVFHFQSLFVSRETLDMALGSKDEEEYISSKYLYFPRGYQNLLQDYLYSIQIQNMGVNSININHDFQIHTQSNVLGSCDSAAYCIISGKQSNINQATEYAAKKDYQMPKDIGHLDIPHLRGMAK